MFDGARTFPGAVLTLEGPDLPEGAYERTSDEKGVFRFTQLSTGTYSLRAEKPGFGRVTLTTVEVAGGHTTAVAVEMKVGEDQVITRALRGFTREFLPHIPSGRGPDGSTPAGTPGAAPAP